ncbi:MAG TPA: hypothetical protein VFH38_02145 [Jatrophihabitans sp.]|nr:hypothetical protein [Jatrophihabitans sp.]
MLLIVICAAIAFVLLALLGLVHFTRARSQELTESLRRPDMRSGARIKPEPR